MRLSPASGDSSNTKRELLSVLFNSLMSITLEVGMTISKGKKISSPFTFVVTINSERVSLYKEFNE